MKFDLEYIEKLAEIVKSSELTELTLEDGEQAIILRKETEVITTAPAIAQTPVVAAQPAPAQVAKTEAQAAPKGTPITSPMVGTFYSAPSPGAEAFAKVGQSLQKGQVVCIVEAMKLMNEIEADVAGTITEICVNDGDPVEFGQVLMYVE